jgi:tRNA(Ile)-lysidine synthase
MGARPGLSPERVGARLAELGAGAGPLLVAVSGGLDSSVLLHLLARGPAAPRLAAIHCDHGLHSAAGEWAARCAALCQRLEVPFEVERLRIALDGGEGLEAAAREARYAALAARLPADGALLTAHHADDQAETFLLMALRGAGPAGLAAMPAAAPLGRGRHLRPLLDHDREELAAYAARHGLAWVDDPSNADLHRDRNRIRHLVLPPLRERWPAASRSLARAATLAAEADRLLATLADADLAPYRDPTAPHRLPLAALAQPDPARVRNLLRRWLAVLGLPTPPATALERMIDEVALARRDARALVEWPGGWVAKHRDALHAGAPLPEPPRAGLAWDARGVLRLPGGTTLALEPARGEGLAAACAAQPLEVRFRAGSEVLRPAGAAHHRPLKKLLAEHGVVPWMRARLPLLYADGQLVAVAGVCVAHELAAAPDAPGLRLVWRGHPPLT